MNARPATPFKVADFFSCVGCHAIGMHAAGFETAQFVEINPFRQAILAKRLPGVLIHDDIRSFDARGMQADIIVGGPPCQQTSVAAAIHGKRTGETLWPEMLRCGLDIRAQWFVVEQPAGNAAWETEVAHDLAQTGFHSARVEFSASDLGAPHQRRRVFILAHRDMQRLESAWRSIPRQIECVARLAASRGTWSVDQLGTLRVDARAPHRVDRKERIEAVGDSNPPAMMEVIGRAILASGVSL